MQIVAEYDQTFVHGNGCLGAESLGKMYIDSGGGTTANLYQADLYVFPLSEFSTTPQAPNTPTPTVVFNESDQEHADAHGAAIARQDRFLWVADRGRNFLWVVDTRTDKVVNRIQLVNELSVDPTPDLLSVSPDGTHVFMSLRGPVPLTADPHVSTGIDARHRRPEGAAGRQKRQVRIYRPHHERRRRRRACGRHASTVG